MKEDSTRRDFLKAAGLAMAGIAGTTLVSRSAWSQEEEKKDQEKPEEKPENEPKDEDEKEEPNYDDLFENGDSEEEETRACPQCGALMYRQGRTWTCENCGYSYVE
ncbi:MAG: twin-arginine translocation signal domain-containing protein [Vicinamibacteria bacterium]